MGWCLPLAPQWPIVAAIDILADNGQVYFGYTVSRNGVQEEIDQAIQTAKVPTPFGGDKRYFVCPSDGCGRRCVKLYIVAGDFRCRCCHRLVYTSQIEREWDRKLRRARKIQGRINAASTKQYLWRRTQVRVLEQMIESSILSDQAIAHKIGKLAAWAEKEAVRSKG